MRLSGINCSPLRWAKFPTYENNIKDRITKTALAILTTLGNLFLFPLELALPISFITTCLIYSLGSFFNESPQRNTPPRPPTQNQGISLATTLFAERSTSQPLPPKFPLPTLHIPRGIFDQTTSPPLAPRQRPLNPYTQPYTPAVIQHEQVNRGHQQQATPTPQPTVESKRHLFTSQSPSNPPPIIEHIPKGIRQLEINMPPIIQSEEANRKHQQQAIPTPQPTAESKRHLFTSQTPSNPPPTTEHIPKGIRQLEPTPNESPPHVSRTNQQDLPIVRQPVGPALQRSRTGKKPRPPVPVMSNEHQQEPKPAQQTLTPRNTKEPTKENEIKGSRAYSYQHLPSSRSRPNPSNYKR